MTRRLIPTGICWCGCRTKVDLGSFFAPGHDKRAESRVIMEVFGGVPQFLKACGYGPDGEDGAVSGGLWLENVLRLAKVPRGAPLVVEYPNISDLSGPLEQRKAELGMDLNLSEGSASFNIPNEGTVSGIYVPFVDVVSVHKTILPSIGAAWAVRVRGLLRPTNSSPAGIVYVAMNHSTDAPLRASSS